MNEQPNKDEKDNSHVPEWLKTVQINSWEAELLISALLLYMLYQVPEYIENYQGQSHVPEEMKLCLSDFV